MEHDENVGQKNIGNNEKWVTVISRDEKLHSDERVSENPLIQKTI